MMVKENDKLDVKIGLQDQDKTFVFKDVDTSRYKESGCFFKRR